MGFQTWANTVLNRKPIIRRDPPKEKQHPDEDAAHLEVRDEAKSQGCRNGMKSPSVPTDRNPSHGKHQDRDVPPG